MPTSRRKAIKALSLLAGASLVSPLPAALGANDAVRPIDKARILRKKGATQAVLVGDTWRGQRIGTYALRRPEEFRIVALAGANAAEKTNVAEELNLPASHRFDHWKEVFAHPRFADVVIVALPGDTSELVETALRAGYDVWVDRSASYDPARNEALNVLARQSGRQLLYLYGFPEELQFMPHKFFPVPPPAPQTA